ncbi:MAG: PEP-CTERM sorting domain-containing protein [Betaproteobacteria bacterium]|nr:MAG: PEP-CTERM sorting domain-containing protein [Betaproteobacteria bacterium]
MRTQQSKEGMLSSHSLKGHSASVILRTGLLTCLKVQANITWEWKYSGPGIKACGTLQTTDTPNSSGFYQILSIAGRRGDDQITGLFFAGRAIPGNASYPVDNLIKATGNAQITVHGFGYSLASGAHSNPYFKEAPTGSGYAEVYTTPGGFSEVPTEFKAAPLETGEHSSPAIDDKTSKCD